MKKILPFLFTLLVTSAMAEDIRSDGNAWHQICNGEIEQAIGQLTCKSFVAGFLAGVDTQAEVFKSKKLFCFPSTGTTEQAKDVFSQFLRNHPEKRHLHVSTIASLALIEGFPCPQSTAGKFSH